MYTLRKYQTEAVEAGTEFLLSERKRNGLIVLPTGSGKSLCVAGIVNRLDAPCLVFQPSKEILEQNLAKFHSYGYRPAVYSASMGRKNVGEITLATIGSVAGNKKRAHKAHLFEDVGYVIIDEADCVNPKEGLYRSFLAALDPSVRVLGLSVGPEMFVEMVGGPFGSGFVGAIEEAFQEALLSGLAIRQEGSLDIIDLAGVDARGWTGQGFDWKPCRSIIRHKGDGAPMKKIVAHGHRLTATEDHSIYRAAPGFERRPRAGRPKYYAKIDCPMSSDLAVKDLLLGDDGVNWDRHPEREYDMVEVAASRLPRSRVRVVCDVSSIPANVLTPHLDSKKKESQLKRWRASQSLPLAAYRSLNGTAPVAVRLTTEGAKVTSDRFIRLSAWAYVLGFYLGDGWITYEKKQTGRMGFAVEHSMEAKVANELRNLKGVSWEICRRLPKHPSGSVDLRASSIFVVGLLTEAIGRFRCHDKHIPGEWIVSWPRESRERLLEGLLDSDGSYGPQTRNKSHRYYTTTSRRLADGLMSLLRSLGVSGSVHERKFYPEGGTVENGTRKILARRPSFTVCWSGHAQEGNAKGRCGTRQKLIHDDLSFAELPIRTVSECVSPPFVYDLSMDGHPSYVASGVLVHNTATPYRMARNSQGVILRFLTRTRPKVFDELVYYAQCKDLFDEGYLAKLEYHKVAGFNRHAVGANSNGTDYDDRSLQTHLYSINFPDKIVKVVERLKERGRKNILIFTRFVREAEYVAQKTGAAIVTAETHKAERTAIVNEFRNGNLPYVVNVGVLTTGADFPTLESVVLARPTMSLRLYYQMVGRAVRPHPDKESAWIIDMVGLSDQFGPVEDLNIIDGGNGKWYIANSEQQLTNVYWADSSATRCRQCGSSIGFWARNARTGNAAPIQRPPPGIKPNIAIKSVNGRTVYDVVPPGDAAAEFISHYVTCGKQHQMRARA